MATPIPKTSPNFLLLLLPLNLHYLFIIIVFTVAGGGVVPAEANWCVARSDASNQALQTAMDYACGTGADCSPIQSTGLCYLPNTLLAHASYAFNSYFQRKNMAPGSCDFSGTATVARTDPSYGSCVYPSSPSTAGGTTATPTSTNNNPNTLTPPTTATPAYGGATTGLNPAGTGTPTLPTDSSEASPDRFTITTVILTLITALLFHHLFTF